MLLHHIRASHFILWTFNRCLVCVGHVVVIEASLADRQRADSVLCVCVCVYLTNLHSLTHSIESCVEIMIFYLTTFTCGPDGGGYPEALQCTAAVASLYAARILFIDISQYSASCPCIYLFIFLLLLLFPLTSFLCPTT